MRMFREFLAADQNFFRSSQSEIMDQNNRVLTEGCVTYTAVLLFYTALTILTDQPAVLEMMYYVFDVLHLLLCGLVWFQRRQRQKRFQTTQTLSALFELNMLSFFALEGAFTSKTQHSLYVPIAILLVLLLFIHRAVYTGLMILLYVSLYAVLSVLYKTPEAYTNDIYMAVATFISANAGYVLIAKMRHNEGAALCKYESLSKMDALTGLLNKAAIERLCEHLITEAEHDCAFIILDLDNFKGVNDNYGHAVGDEVLVLVGQTLKNSFRDRDYIGRFGGDEFIVLMDECGDEEIVKKRVERVIQRISELQCPAPELKVCCSAGIAIKREPERFEAVFKRADHALYRAKTEEKGSYRIGIVGDKSDEK